MRYYNEMIACADKLNLYTIWAMLAHAQEINKQYPPTPGNWFLEHQVVSLVHCVDMVSKYLRVPSISIDQDTVDFVLQGLTHEAMLCRGDSDVTCYSLEYSMAAETLRDLLAEKFKC